MKAHFLFLLLLLFFNSPAQSAWINEIHYDNVGTDQNEGLEILVDTNALNWHQLYVQAYNGNNGLSYGTALKVDQADSVNSIGSYIMAWLPWPGLQNGPSDGLCLYLQQSSGDSVLQFLCYEGPLQAGDGPANGQNAVDIGISENSSTALGQSLQLQGLGVANFNWTLDSASPASFNINQGLQSPVSLSSADVHIISRYRATGSIDFKNFSDTTQAGVLLNTFVIKDGKPFDSDSLDCYLNELQFLLEPAHSISRISLHASGHKLAEHNNPSTSLSFSNLQLRIPDDDSLVLDIRLCFKEAQLDGSKLSLKVTNLKADPGFSQFEASSYDLLDSGKAWLDVQASMAHILNLPDTLFSLLPYNNLKILALDSFGNIDKDYEGKWSYWTSLSLNQADSLNFINGKAICSLRSLNAQSGYYQFYGHGDLGSIQDSFYLASPKFSSPLIITGVYDGPLAWGQPKGIELFAFQDIPDLSIYSVGVANNGGGSDGPEIQLRPLSITAGDYYFLCSDSLAFVDFFEFSPNQSSGTMNLNGDDAVELFHDSTRAFNGQERLVDLFGDPLLLSIEWDYSDAWAYRKAGNTDTNFQSQSWYYAESNKFSGAAKNSLLSQPFPFKTYQAHPKGADFIFDGLNWYPYAPLGALKNYSALMQAGISRMDQDLSIGSFNLSPLAKLELMEGVKWEVFYQFKNDGELFLEHASSLKLRDSCEYLGTGDFCIEAKIEVPDHRRFSFWSSPVSNITFGDIFGQASNLPTNPQDWYAWSVSQQAWLPGNDSTILKAGRGYICSPSPQSNPFQSVAESRYFKSNPHSGSISIYEPHQAGDYLLLGNPYAAPLDQELFMAANPSLDGNVYLWDNSLSYNSQAYAIWNNNHRLAASPLARTPDSSLASCQAFFVRALQAADSIFYSPSMQVLQRPKFFKQGPPKREVLLSLKSGKESAHSKLVFKEHINPGFLASEDALWLNSGGALAILPQLDSVNYAIKTIDPTIGDTIWLYTRLDTGLHQIQLKQDSGLVLELYDSELDIVHPLSLQDYPFVQAEKSSARRFALIFNSSGLPLQTKTQGSPDSFTVYQSQGYLYWECSLEIQRLGLVSSEGKILLERTIQSQRQGRVDLRHYPKPAILSIYLESSQTLFKQKVLIKP